MALGKEMFAEFFQKIFAEGNGTALGKELFFFFEKSLPRASPKALGKEFYFLKKKSLPSVPNHGPRQRNVVEILFFF